MLCGIVSPSALAVLRLTTTSNFVGCSTGRSAGLAPLRIFVYVYSNPGCEILEIRTVRHEAARLDELAPLVGRWRSCPDGQIDERVTLTEEIGIGGHEDGIRLHSHDRREGLAVRARAPESSRTPPRAPAPRPGRAPLRRAGRAGGGFLSRARHLMLSAEANPWKR